MTRGAFRGFLPPALAVALLCTSAPAFAEKTETLTGYAEYRKGSFLIVEGQRVVADGATKYKGSQGKSLAAIELGDEVQVKGIRRADGTFLAREIAAKENDLALFEQDALDTADELEAEWLQGGALPDDEAEDDDEASLGAIADDGPQVARVRRILARLMPPYVEDEAIRAYVVDNADWNAMAMANGAVWVFSGLLRDFDDDEVAVVIGHEIAHVTHEHLRREMKRSLWTGALSLGLDVIAEAIGGKKGAALEVAGAVFTLAWQNGYSRDLEDQADRVGLRYAFEGGYDVTKAPQVWQRFADKYGSENTLVNFFLGGHSRAPERKKNLAAQVAWNYAGTVDRPEVTARSSSRDEALDTDAPPQVVVKRRSGAVATGESATAAAAGPQGFRSRAAAEPDDDADEQREEMRDALKVRPGMTADQVRKILGAPDTRTTGPDGSIWSYDDMDVLIVDGRVETITFR